MIPPSFTHIYTGSYHGTNIYASPGKGGAQDGTRTGERVFLIVYHGVPPGKGNYTK
jgi:hypothetical protein